MEFIIGESKRYRFQITDKNGDVIETMPDALSFNLKIGSETILTKSLEDGDITFNSEDSYFYFTMQAEDTAGLSAGCYGYNITVAYGEIVKKSTGQLTLQKAYGGCNGC